MKKSFFFLTMAVALLLSSCNEPVQPDQIQVNPSPLQVKAGRVTAEMKGTFPEKKFVRRGVLVVTPVLKYNGKEMVGDPVTYVGEKVKENGKVVDYAKGGTYSQSINFPYEEDMAVCELYLRFEARKRNKTYDVPDLKIADGIVTTAMLADASNVPGQVTGDKFQRTIQEMQEADIMFLISQSTLRSSETGSQAVKDLCNAIKDANNNEKKAINNLEVAGYASPDGGMELNTRLAEERQAKAQKFLQDNMKKNKVKSDIQANMTSEDWEGFQAAMENSNIQDKDLVLRVLSMYEDPEEREAQIKNLSNVYRTIADDVLPALRRSRLILTTDIIGRSDEEITDAVKNDPAALNVEELLYAATLTNNQAEKMDIYKQVTTQFPDDYRGWNNLGLSYMKEGNVAEARRCYTKALEIAPDNADVNYNAAIAAMADNDVDKAQQYLGKAAGTKGDLNTAMGTYYTQTGDYQKAKTAYAESASNNAAVQQILNEDYAAARKTLAAVAEPDATTAYLQAIVGARTNDREAVYSNLRTAIERNAKMKTRAQKDIEFSKFAEDETFQSIIK
ncbi:MAG: tetratricopeptide repeat protein [Paludibacteraceae bacterium]|nr:tetratricopeptide repeat protein [Paludibacteraceae bacterium]